jgi:hypothetical protein
VRGEWGEVREEVRGEWGEVRVVWGVMGQQKVSKVKAATHNMHMRV